MATDLCKICDEPVVRAMFLDSDGPGYEWLHASGYSADRTHMATHYHRE